MSKYLRPIEPTKTAVPSFIVDIPQPIDNEDEVNNESKVRVIQLLFFI